MPNLNDQQIQEIVQKLKNDPAEVEKLKSQMQGLMQPAEKPGFNLGRGLRAAAKAMSFYPDEPKQQKYDPYTETFMKKLAERQLEPPKEKTIKEKAMDAIALGQTLPGMTAEQTQKVAGAFIEPQPVIPEGYTASAVTSGGVTYEKPSTELTGGQKLAKDKATNEIFTTLEDNKVKRQLIKQAQQSSEKIRGGLFGKLQKNWMGQFDPNNPLLGDWQNIKMVLTDATLMNTAKTKGAISDMEMLEFMKAAANDDVASFMRMKPVFEKLLMVLDADEKAKVGAYKQNYGEDPSGWFPKEDQEIEVISPTGVPGTIPASQLEEALKEGYRRT
jgi:hypothetical protein